MFTFHWSELLVVIVGGLGLLLGLALVMLRRRNEVLQKFLTPEEPNLEEEFFRVPKPKQTEPPQDENADDSEEKTNGTADVS
jgi:LPXTG-motif cell wall-anchored protein